MSMVLVPYTAEQDGSGVWSARADLGRFGFAYGEGATQQDAVDDLKSGIALVFEDEGSAPDWLPRADVVAVPEVA
jgi:hypothetical protein